MNAMRWTLLILAAAILPSCRRHHDDWVIVTVTNDGTDWADVQAEARYWSGLEDDPELSVGPGQQIQIHFPMEGLNDLRVRIYRRTDHLLLFSETWDWEELRDLNEHVAIQITP